MANDEFYTPLATVEEELQHYDFYNMAVYCPCDADWSAFAKYFKKNRRRLKLNGFARSSSDFRHYKAQDLMARCDVVVTNPPFSLFGKFLRQIKAHGKKFIVIGGNSNIGTAIDVFGPDRIQIGASRIRHPYHRPDGTTHRISSVWLTNMSHHQPRPQGLLPSHGRRYDPNEYDFTDCGILHVGLIKDIPIDYFGPMAVGERYFIHHDPDLFTVANKCIAPTIAGRPTYRRLVIQRNLVQGKKDQNYFEEKLKFVPVDSIV